ncbi:MAG: hypothetical protein JSR97_01355 [Verrucomicrobia bacterium]|nr:hypothetical protein [Verrucomicrobiota bacterium]
MKGNIDQLIRTTEIQDNIVSASVLLDEQTKQALHNQSSFVREFLANNPKANSYQQKSLASQILTYWNESVNSDTEAFWSEMKSSDVAIERKEPLRFALEKGWFRNVEQGIDARNHWSSLKHFPSVRARYSQAEIERLDQIIEEDENKRHEVLKKCLAKKAIPQTQYLKFGECMAYCGRCNLFEVYFSAEQVEELYEIWKNFKSL